MRLLVENHTQWLVSFSSLFLQSSFCLPLVPNLNLSFPLSIHQPRYLPILLFLFLVAICCFFVVWYCWFCKVKVCSKFGWHRLNSVNTFVYVSEYTLNTLIFWSLETQHVNKTLETAADFRPFLTSGRPFFDRKFGRSHRTVGCFLPADFSLVFSASSVRFPPTGRRLVF